LVAHLHFYQPHKAKQKFKRATKPTHRNNPTDKTTIDRRAADNKGLAKCGGEVLRMNICAKFELWCFD